MELDTLEGGMAVLMNQKYELFPTEDQKKMLGAAIKTNQNESKEKVFLHN